MTTEATLGPLPEPWIVGGVLNAPIEGQFTASQMRKYAAQEVAAERAEIERLRAALNDIATHMSSDWPERCIRHVRIARAALKEKP